jgi:hypothetical protein
LHIPNFYPLLSSFSIVRPHPAAGIVEESRDRHTIAPQAELQGFCGGNIFEGQKRRLKCFGKIRIRLDEATREYTLSTAEDENAERNQKMTYEVVFERDAFEDVVSRGKAGEEVDSCFKMGVRVCGVI